jgi:AcrR family transcriptional regulator
MTTLPKLDRQVALAKATDLFWKKGFKATSMREIQETMDMRPGSIYSCFGSKEGLYEAALEKYTEDQLVDLGRCAIAEKPLAALENFVRSEVLNRSTPDSRDLCMLMKTVSELNDENQKLLAVARRLIGLLEEGIIEIISNAQACGEICQTRDPKHLANYLQMQVMGLRAFSRTFPGDPRIKQLLTDVFRGVS